MIAEINPAIWLEKNHGRRLKKFRLRARVIVWIWRALGRSYVPRSFDKSCELLICDRVLVDPKSFDAFFMHRRFLESTPCCRWGRTEQTNY
jgi:hypothetical protein